jgi:hypothetical protein
LLSSCALAAETARAAAQKENHFSAAQGVFGSDDSGPAFAVSLPTCGIAADFRDRASYVFVERIPRKRQTDWKVYEATALFFPLWLL